MTSLGPRLIYLLQNYAFDLDVLAHFTTKLIETLNIAEVRSSLNQHGSSLAIENLTVEALASPSTTVNKLGLALIHAYVRSGEHEVHGFSKAEDLTTVLIKVWLTSPESGVGSDATKCLLDMLSISKDDRDPRNLWRILFSPRHLGLIYRNVMIQSNNSRARKNQKSLAQSRLLDAIPAMVKMNMRIPIQPLTGTTWSALASENHCTDAYPGHDNDSLLCLAALHMVDEEDIPVSMVLTRFWEQLVLVLESNNIDKLPPGEDNLFKDYSLLIGTILSRDTPGAQRVSAALSVLPGKFVHEDIARRVKDFMAALANRAMRDKEQDT